MVSLINLRKAHPAFRLRTAREIREHLQFEAAPSHAVAYTLRNHAGGDEDQHLYVVYNANAAATELELPDLGAWEVRYGQELVANLDSNCLEVKGIGIVVLAVRP
ncbi:Pullulanase precursor [compost metagenome]